MSGYTLTLPMPAGREAFLIRAGMVFCQLWQIFACPAASAGKARRRSGTSEGQNGAKFSSWENFASSRSAGTGKASAVKYVT